MLDLDQFEERAAIMEFDGSLSRFAAESAAAREQGLERWEVRDAISKRHFEKTRDQRQGAERDAAHDLPGMQRPSAQEARSLPVGNVR